jgi:hypothetical protein
MKEAMQDVRVEFHIGIQHEMIFGPAENFPDGEIMGFAVSEVFAGENILDFRVAKDKP